MQSQYDLERADTAVWRRLNHPSARPLIGPVPPTIAKCPSLTGRYPCGVSVMYHWESPFSHWLVTRSRPAQTPQLGPFADLDSRSPNGVRGVDQMPPAEEQSTGQQPHRRLSRRVRKIDFAHSSMASAAAPTRSWARPRTLSWRSWSSRQARRTLCGVAGGTQAEVRVRPHGRCGMTNAEIARRVRDPGLRLS